MSRGHSYTKDEFIAVITTVCNELGYFPSEKEYRIYRKNKSLPMPKVSKSATGLTWRNLGIHYFKYYPRTLNIPIQKTCKLCSKIINVENRDNKIRNFCSHSCSATYNNTHKTHGTKRSKLEIWLEEQLTTLYSNLEIHFNRKDAINSELDIYIPSLSLAFELNGIFHYEPIYGKEKLEKIQNNDGRKFQACLENNIELCIIDTSSQIKFAEKSSIKFLDIIIKIINIKQGD